jgi:CHAD domain-containing protein
MFDAARSERLRSELRWLGGLLGAVRDGDVLAERIGAALRAQPPELVVGPVEARIRQRLTAGASEARDELDTALDGDRYRTLLDALDALVAAGPSRTNSKRLQRRARRALRRADRLLATADRARPGSAGTPDGGHDRAAPPAGNDRDAALHEARKAYKRARYAVEVLDPVAGKPSRRLVKRLTTLQDVLGAHQDAVVASQVLREYGMRAHLDGDNAFTYGLLVARQQQVGADALARLPRVRRRAHKRRVRGWLG